MTTAPTPDTPTELFWIATVQPTQQHPGTYALHTYKGTYTPQPGETRDDVFGLVRNYIAGQLQHIGQPPTHNVLFYSAEPNQL